MKHEQVRPEDDLNLVPIHKGAWNVYASRDLVDSAKPEEDEQK